MDATQDTPGVPGTSEAGDRFGSALSLGFLVGSNGTIDAAVGAPGEDVGSAANAGAVTILSDLYDQIESGVRLDQDVAGVPGSAEAGDVFGSSVDTVRVGLVGSYLAVGAPGEDVGRASGAGLVQLFRSSNRTAVTASTALTQDSTGVAGVAESSDAFGGDIAFIPTGPGNSRTRLAVGIAGEDGDAVNSGAVSVFPLADIDAETTYTQNTTGMPGRVDAGDRFGASLAAVRGASETALLIGVPDDVEWPMGMINIVPLGGGTKRYWAPGCCLVPTSGMSRFGDALASVSD
jgi:hypothetical protein